MYCTRAQLRTRVALVQSDPGARADPKTLSSVSTLRCACACTRCVSERIFIIFNYRALVYTSRTDACASATSVHPTPPSAMPFEKIRVRPRGVSRTPSSAKPTRRVCANLDTTAKRIVTSPVTPAGPPTAPAAHVQVHRPKDVAVAAAETPRVSKKLHLPLTPTSGPKSKKRKIRVKGGDQRTQPVGRDSAGPLARRLAAALGSDVDPAPTIPFVPRFSELPLHADRVRVVAHIAATLPTNPVALLIDSAGECALLHGQLPRPPDDNLLVGEFAVDERRVPSALARLVVENGEIHNAEDGATTSNKISAATAAEAVAKLTPLCTLPLFRTD